MRCSLKKGFVAPPLEEYYHIQVVVHTFPHIRHITLWRGVKRWGSGRTILEAQGPRLAFSFLKCTERGKAERGRIHTSQSGADSSKGRAQHGQLRGKLQMEIILLTPLLKLRDGAWKCLNDCPKMKNPIPITSDFYLLLPSTSYYFALGWWPLKAPGQF